MHLSGLTIQGFKTFAKKTTLPFSPPKIGHIPVTGVVGPNGSGKSNVADAIRWVLGEQSLKLLRGKKSEDVIFSGSEGRGKSGFAEVSLTLDNADRAIDLDAAEITITRRLYRSGEGEYLVNQQPARLLDLLQWLAQANVGQKSYSVIGQGMIDHVLIASPEERKTFFDDATGVRPLQLKRHEAMLKLIRSCEHLSEIQRILQEIEPRVRSLKRQVARLEEREAVERQLLALEGRFYGSQWWSIQDDLKELQGKEAPIKTALEEKKVKRKALEEKFAALASDGPSQDTTADQGLAALQSEQTRLQKEISRLREEQFQAEKTLEIKKIQSQSSWSPLPLDSITRELGSITTEQTALLIELKAATTTETIQSLLPRIERLFGQSGALLKRLQRPAPEQVAPDPAALAQIEASKKAQETTRVALAAIQEKISGYATQEKRVRHDLLDLQQQLTGLQKEIHAFEKNAHEQDIARIRLEERRSHLTKEMEERMPAGRDEVMKTRPTEMVMPETIEPEIRKLRYKLELIGGIEPEVLKEFEESNARFEFLSTQTNDLEKAIASTETLIDALDEDIAKQSEEAFQKIDKEFEVYFKLLFGGGSCKLVRMTKDDTLEPSSEVTLDRASEETAASERQEHEEDTEADRVKARLKRREERFIGVDIQATPPGKRLKSLNLLSGGERALTAIALLCAIMAVNPAPFVLLDEVDAALDESNTVRFANILSRLSEKTQFILITHNRATMEIADTLYGVTMGEDGVSSLLSVQLSDMEGIGNARR
ncbi:AAA family ATPase [Candidatus Uhrbacteria bacterium]|nr:AAA family ATPase [Candidatus Uhrbacteria bacterium]